MQYRPERHLSAGYPSTSGVSGVPALRRGSSPARYGENDDHRGGFDGQKSYNLVGDSAACSGRKWDDDVEGDR